SALWNPELRRRRLQRLLLFLPDVGGLNDQEIPVRTVLMDVQLASREPRLAICFIVTRDQAQEALVLARGEPIDFHLHARNRSHRRRWRAAACRGYRCNDQSYQHYV